MAGYALYGMAPCFGHTGVTFDVEMIGLVPAASEISLRRPSAGASHEWLAMPCMEWLPGLGIQG